MMLSLSIFLYEIIINSFSSSFLNKVQRNKIRQILFAPCVLYITFETLRREGSISTVHNILSAIISIDIVSRNATLCPTVSFRSSSIFFSFFLSFSFFLHRVCPRYNNVIVVVGHAKGNGHGVTYPYSRARIIHATRVRND